jgi:hypothetical protein
MNIEVNCSIGEIYDKITILIIKKNMISEEIKLNNINKELILLINKLNKLNINFKNEELFSDLLKTNLKLWLIEDDIREFEKKEEFNNNFIKIARSVYIVNDKRFSIKNKINNKNNSVVKEVKCYDNLNYDNFLSKSNEINIITKDYLNNLDLKIDDLIKKFKY